jgi:hypothetical protein
MVDTVQCPGCHRPVDVARPPNVHFEILADQNAEAPGVVTVVVGRLVVHRCTRCPDGEWR